MHVDGDVSNSLPAIFGPVICVFVLKKTFLHGSGFWSVWLKHAFLAFCMIRGPVYLGHQEAGIWISSWNSLSSKRQLNMKDCVPPADLSLSFTSEIRQVEAALTSGSYLPDMIKIPRKSTHVSVVVVESPPFQLCFYMFFLSHKCHYAQVTLPKLKILNLTNNTASLALRLGNVGIIWAISALSSREYQIFSHRHIFTAWWWLEPWNFMTFH